MKQTYKIYAYVRGKLEYTLIQSSDKQEKEVLNDHVDFQRKEHDNVFGEGQWDENHPHWQFVIKKVNKRDY